MSLLNQLLRPLLRRRLPAPSPRERALIEELRAKIEQLPKILTSSTESDAERLWLQNRVRLRQDLLSEDPRCFISSSVIGETMFVNKPSYIAFELSALQSSPVWRTRWQPALAESVSIPAPRSPHYSSSSGNLIHQAYHLWQFGQLTGGDVAKYDVILEFGGGYGAMCRLIHQLGFRGAYYIFDLPEFGALQEFYLQANDLPVSQGFDSVGPSGVVCFSNFEQFKQLNRQASIDLLIATWSLSETPLEFRHSIFDSLSARSALVAYQHEFAGIDNAKFFSECIAKDCSHQWSVAAATHLPGLNSYLVGCSRNSKGHDGAIGVGRAETVKLKAGVPDCAGSGGPAD